MKQAVKHIIILALSLVLLAGCSGATPQQEAAESAPEQSAPSENGESAENKANTEIIQTKSFDGYTVEGKLSLPGGEDDISKLVIYIPGTGPHTYDDPMVQGDSVVNKLDFYRDEFSKNGIAFYAYNQRGVHANTTPPQYFEINEEEYKTYLPLNSVEDIYYTIKVLKENDRLKNSKIYLYGGSEGTLISAIFAEKYPDMVDGLFLAAYVNENMMDTMLWQFNGYGFVQWFHNFFEADGQGRISKQAYEAGPTEITQQLPAFEDIDRNGNGYLEEEEMRTFGASLFNVDMDGLLAATERGDNEWVLNNLLGNQITAGWLSQHLSLETNMERLPRLELPIQIFHGAADYHVNVEGVYKVNEKFEELGKTNLKINIFKRHDHSLNFYDYFSTGVVPEGIQAIIDAVVGMK